MITGPYTLARLSRLGGGYADVASAARDLAAILNQEALALEQAGATIVQFDEPAILKHPEDLALFQQLSRRVVESVKVKTAVYTYFGDAVELGEGFLDSPFQVIGLDFASGKRNWELLSRFPDDKELGIGIWHSGRPQHQAGDS